MKDHISDYIVPFLVGGGLVAGIKGLSARVDPAYAAMLGAFPLGFASVYFIQKSKVNSYFKNYILSLTTLLICSFVFLMGSGHLTKDILLALCLALIATLSYVRVTYWKV